MKKVKRLINEKEERRGGGGGKGWERGEGRFWGKVLGSFFFFFFSLGGGGAVWGVVRNLAL